MAYGAAVAQGHFDQSAAWRGGVVQFSISDHLHALHDGAYLRVGHVLARVAIGKRDGAVYQGRGDEVLAVDVWHRTVTDNAGPVLRQPDNYALDIVGAQSILAAKGKERIQGGLVGVAHGIGLDARLRDKIPAAQIGHDRLGVRLGGKRLDRVVPSAQYIADTGKSRLDHDHSSHAVAGAHAADVKGFLNVIGILDPAPEA